MEVSLRNRLLARGLQFVSTWIKYTCNISVTGLEHIHNIRASGRPVLWTSWHGQTMMIINLYLNDTWRAQINNPKIKIMIPDDWRGESLYAWLNLIQFTPYPMNLENQGMGTARKFAELVRTIKAGGDFDNYIAPDGPSGPSYEIKPGAIFLAKKSGAPLLPVGAYTRVSYELNRWDAFAVPLPFSHTEIFIGEPIEVPRKGDTAEIQERLTQALHHVTLSAKAKFYEGKGH